MDYANHWCPGCHAPRQCTVAMDRKRVERFTCCLCKRSWLLPARKKNSLPPERRKRMNELQRIRRAKERET